MSAEIILLDPGESTNKMAWWTKAIDDLGDSDRVLILSINEWKDKNGKTRGDCMLSYFNMNEFMLTWASAKVSDFAASMRKRES